jgi:GTPase SAR1 family protein
VKGYRGIKQLKVKPDKIEINMKIGLCGTMSVGKTTLVNALKELPEFKDYTTRTERSKELMAMGIPLNTDSTLKGQTVFLAERASELMCENIITDRTVIDVMAFTQASKSINYIDKEDFINHAKNLISEYDHIFYVSPEGVEIENNGVRETDAEYRDLIDFIIKSTINRYNHRIKNLHRISGSTEERIKLIQQAISL